MSQSDELERHALLSEPPPAPVEAAQPVPDSEAASSSSSFATEEFLFHLYRGSELLQDARVGEAKEELERALALQPADIEGQGLLAVVYFRLGLYPRAIDIYEQIAAERPEEITPRLNLGLCYLKTGQLLRARETLSEVIERAPEREKAWAYLGLVYERLGELEKAAHAFERAGQPQMARRMRDRLEELAGAEAPTSRRESLVPPAPVDLEAESVPASSPALRPLVEEIGAQSRAPSSLTVRRLTEQLSLDPAGGRVQRRSPVAALVRLEGPLVVRPAQVRVLSPEGGPFETSALRRRVRGRDLDESLGGTRAPLKALSGQGWVLLSGAPELLVLELDRELFFVREDRLVGFDLSLGIESGRLTIGSVEHLPMSQLSGSGLCVLEVGPAMAAVRVAGEPVLARGADVLGWVGRLLAEPLPPSMDLGPGLVRFTGEGSLLVDPR